MSSSERNKEKLVPEGKEASFILLEANNIVSTLNIHSEVNIIFNIIYLNITPKTFNELRSTLSFK
jgi:hypothetical protein